MNYKSKTNFRVRTAILIDGQNIYLSAKAKRAKLDFSAILETMDSREITRAIIYNVAPNGVDQSNFFRAMDALSFEVKSKEHRTLPDGTVKADWDMQIAIDALALAEKVDVIVILSGDSDFIPLVYALKSKGVRVEIMSFRETTGSQLISVADKYTEINNKMLTFKESFRDRR